MDNFDRGAFLGLAPPCGALVCAMDFRLAPPLVPLFGGGIMASGVIVIAFASSLTKVLSGTKLMERGTPSKLYVELEPM